MNVILWMLTMQVWMQCYEYTVVNVVLWMPVDDDDLTGGKTSSLGDKKLEDGKWINLSAVNVGERDIE